MFRAFKDLEEHELYSNVKKWWVKFLTLEKLLHKKTSNLNNDVLNWKQIQKDYLEKSAPPNHRRNQLSCLLCSTPEQDHHYELERKQSLPRDTLFQSPYQVDGLMKRETTQPFPLCTTWRPMLSQCTPIYFFPRLIPSQSNLESIHKFLWYRILCGYWVLHWIWLVKISL